jgi:hypothetical protein
MKKTKTRRKKTRTRSKSAFASLMKLSGPSGPLFFRPLFDCRNFGENPDFEILSSALLFMCTTMNDTLQSSLASDTQPDHDTISRHAQDLWEKYGRPTGRDEEIWLEAERALKTPDATPTPSSPSSAAMAAAPTSAPASKAGAPKNSQSSRATAAAKIPALKASRATGR